MATSFPMTCAQTIVSASHCVGLTLPGIIELPGSLAGIMISPIPERGPDAIKRISFAILFNDTANCFNAPCVSTIASCAASASNLLCAVIKGRRVNSAIYSATRFAYPFGVLIPVPTAVPPRASSARCLSVNSKAAIP